MNTIQKNSLLCLADWLVELELYESGNLTVSVAHTKDDHVTEIDSDIGRDDEHSRRFTTGTIETYATKDKAPFSYMSLPDEVIGNWSVKVVSDDDGHLSVYCSNQHCDDDTSPTGVTLPTVDRIFKQIIRQAYRFCLSA